MNARLPLPTNLHGVAQARRFTTQTLTNWSLAHLSDDAALLVGELATNALLHGDQPAELRLAADDNEVRVEMHDGSDLLPRLRHYGPTSTTGRGLRLVHTLSNAWGAELTGTGKRVWFVLGVHQTGTDVEEVFSFDLDTVDAL